MPLTDALTTLETAGLIRLFSARPELEYIFRHALVQDAAYSSLLHRQRRDLHRATGEALEAGVTGDAQRAELAPLLAHHFEQAGDGERAVRYFTLAGEAAAAQYALPEAISFFTRALTMAAALTSAPEAALTRLYRLRGHAQRSLEQWDDAWRNYLDMDRAGQARGDRSMQLASLTERATLVAVFGPLFDHEQVLTLSAQALALARDLNDRAAEAGILWNMGRALSFRDAAQGIVHGEQSVALARELGLTEQLAYSLGDLHYAYQRAGRPDEALAVLAEARALWRALGQQHMLADNLNQTAMLLFPRGELDQVLALSTEANAVSVASCNPSQSLLSHLNAALALMDRGRADLALEKLEEAWRQAPAAWYYGSLALGLAQVWAALGDTAHALRFQQEHTVLIRHLPIWPAVGPGLLGQEAQLLIRLGDLDGAAARLEEADLLPWFGNRRERLNFGNCERQFLAEIELALARGAPAAAMNLSTALVSDLRRLALRRVLPEALALQATAYAAIGQPEPAYHALLEARTIATEIDQRRTLWSILARLAGYEHQRGRQQPAAVLRAEAAGLVAFIAEHAGTPELRAAFLSLPMAAAVLLAA